MKGNLLIVVGLVCWAGAAGAGVVVEFHDRPLGDTRIEGWETVQRTGGLSAPATKANVPESGQWFIPHFQADRLADGDSTYFSIRSEGALPANVVIEYFDVYSSLQKTQSVELEPREVRTIAVKHVPNLPIGSDGYARGFIRISSLVPVMVDFFQLETRNAFAVGGVGFVEDDFCARWNARFLRFGTSGGTTLSMMINGPQGRQPSDPATLLGDVYSESGDYLGSFSIRTDEWSLEIPVHDLIPNGVEFGVVELIVNSRFLPAGIIEVRHQALGQFSVGHWATCMD